MYTKYQSRTSNETVKFEFIVRPEVSYSFPPLGAVRHLADQERGLLMARRVVARATNAQESRALRRWLCAQGLEDRIYFQPGPYSTKAVCVCVQCGDPGCS